MNADVIRSDFPITDDLIYLDSAATSLMPRQVAEAISAYDLRYRANIGRSVHRLSVVATQRYLDAHDRIASFIGGESGTTVITKNTTEAIGIVASGIPWEKGDRVVTTALEHHSNLLPWLRLRNRGVNVDIVMPEADGTIDPAAFEAAVTDETRLVAITHASNVLGALLPVRKIADICHEHGAELLVDGAQSVPHIPIDVKDLGCDYLCFSGHKMLGPSGTGVLWMQEMTPEPLIIGGGSVEAASLTGYTLAGDYRRYEGGTPPIGGTIGLGEAVKYLTSLGMEDISRHEEWITRRLLDGLTGIDGVIVHGPDTPGDRIGVVSFTVPGMHPHDVAHILDEASDIMVRSGDHCCKPLMELLELPQGTVRASTYLYTTGEEIDLLLRSLEEIVRMVE
ncbi:aminotransferase class V [Methanocalculus chunghsingensis]|uniref:cysteine desulfurase n=1 Tax=Methanocalculus chunghsingensis TaxID=156457 RepID=A0A8J8B562_9EURY|nr:cysteine desulfurase [Methanocalculus chunghsingensis]MBR1368788.1 aminotransferase class V [Methanocalculus chunghsingensis]